jgi:hypothetical protein
MGRMRRRCAMPGFDQSEIDDYLKRAMASDYDQLLRVSMETENSIAAPPRKAFCATDRKDAAGYSQSHVV